MAVAGLTALGGSSGGKDRRLYGCDEETVLFFELKEVSRASVPDWEDVAVVMAWAVVVGEPRQTLRWHLENRL